MDELNFAVGRHLTQKAALERCLHIQSLRLVCASSALVHRTRLVGSAALDRPISRACGAVCGPARSCKSALANVQRAEGEQFSDNSPYDAVVADGACACYCCHVLSSRLCRLLPS